MKSKGWTPGPWEAKRSYVGTEYPLFITAQGRDGLRPWCDDDARVMAASKKLYKALLTIVRQNAGGHPVGHDAILAARAALAEASGRKGQEIDWTRERLPSGIS